MKKDEANPDSWLNLGTIRLQRNKLSGALTSYEKARKLDPNNAASWYSIGVVHDYMRNYDEAVEAYTVALTLDPSLVDAKKNPQAVNNERLMVVNLLLYQAKEGGLALRCEELRRRPSPRSPPRRAPPSRADEAERTRMRIPPIFALLGALLLGGLSAADEQRDTV